MVYIFNGKDIGKIVALIFLDKTQKRKKIKVGQLVKLLQGGIRWPIFFYFKGQFL